MSGQIESIIHEVLTRDEAAKLLRCLPSTVAWYTKNRKIPSFRLGRERKYLKAHLLEWMERESQRSTNREPAVFASPNRGPDIKGLRKELSGRRKATGAPKPLSDQPVNADPQSTRNLQQNGKPDVFGL